MTLLVSKPNPLSSERLVSFNQKWSRMIKRSHIGTDKGMLDQVIYNLLNNAAIHTDVNSSIDISATCYTDLLEIIIEDNGEGFKDVDPKEVFYKFSRGKDPKSSGSGLGFSIVKGFTEALGGNVEL